jgi:ATPase subunit of ABC transporter with duplicated ATPase domains
MEDPEQADHMDRILARFGEVQEEYEHLGGYSLEAQAREVLHGLSFEDDQIDGDVGALSGGWKMRVALARVLLGRPDVLLADEPTNHLDIESIIWLEHFLKSYAGALLMTSHDREFMNRVVSKIAEIDSGEIVTYSGDYEFYERERAIRENNQQAAFARQQAMFAKEQRFIDRFKTHAAKAAQVQSRIKALDKIEKIELPRKRHVVKFEFRAPPRSGDQVAVIEDLHKRYGPRVIYDGFDLTIRRGERWAVMGKNGAGKTTLLKMIAGVSAPDSGSVRLGASLNMGYFAQQSLDVLDPELTVMEQLLKDFPQDGLGPLRTLAGAFQFSGDDVDKRVRALSGGEKSRLAMARMLYNPPNFLVLDEPTNHLDLATKEMLVEALHDFEGTMIFVSHDRTFLRGLSSRVLELGGESGRDRTPVVYPGTYKEYVDGPRSAGDLCVRAGFRAFLVEAIWRRDRLLSSENSTRTNVRMSPCRVGSARSKALDTSRRAAPRRYGRTVWSNARGDPLHSETPESDRPMAPRTDLPGSSRGRLDPPSGANPGMAGAVSRRSPSD